jgi:hypothetical protein
MLFTRKKLLEWSPSSEFDRSIRTSLFASFRQMWIAPVLAIVAFAYLAMRTPRRWRCRADPAAVVRFARHRMVDQPDACAPRRRGSRPDQTIFLRELFAQDVGVLRELRRSR